MLIAQITDVHLGFEPDNPDELNRKRFDLVLAELIEGRNRPDLMLVTGDLADRGDVESYARVAEALKRCPFPVYPALGNHDDRKNTRGAIVKMAGAEQAIERKLVTTVDAGPVQLILLDSLLATNVTPEQLGAAQRNWLASHVGTLGSKPAIVFVHHNLDPNDDNALVDAAALLDIVKIHARRESHILWAYARLEIFEAG